MKTRKFLLTAVMFLAVILRFYQLGKTPAALEWDEVAIGYDAYSILHTGRDQFGTFLPLTFRSLDDYKPPIYEYLAVPSIAVFGLNEFSVRLPSAVFGVLAVFLTYWLTLLITSRMPKLKRHKYKLALSAAFFLAISPWHLQFSRATFEMLVSVTITIAAVVTFLAGLKKPKLFILSGLLFGLNLFSYHSARVVSPLLMAALFILFNKTLPSKKFIVSFLVLFGFFFTLFIPILRSPEAQIRFTATNIFTPGARYLDEEDLPKKFLDERLKDIAAEFETAGKIFHNQRLVYADYPTLKKAFQKYLSNFGFEFLFISGDAPLHHAPGFGLLYIVELPFIFLGIIFISRNLTNRYLLIIPIWLLLAPIPDAVTREAPHAIRSMLMLPAIQIITAFGLISIMRLLKKESRWVYIFGIIFGVMAISVNISSYLHQYYVHTNYDLSKNWLYGRKEAVNITEKLKSNYDKVLVSMHVDMPYIFWLFYTKYSPDQYLKGGGTISGGFADERNHFDKYEFRNFDYNSFPRHSGLLLVGLPNDFPPGAHILNRINYLNSTPALVIADTD
jgi:4-amino-4-deoxy-L-arabinose transferase-like glycosyltransferase